MTSDVLRVDVVEESNILDVHWTTFQLWKVQGEILIVKKTYLSYLFYHFVISQQYSNSSLFLIIKKSHATGGTGTGDHQLTSFAP